jgi:hypothetical protein
MLNERTHERFDPLIGDQHDRDPAEYFNREAKKCTFVSLPS